jgi:serine protease Do
MDPPPGSLREPRMNLLSGRQLYGAVTFGVEGTAMPAHTWAYTPQERWDVAFFVATLRDGFDPRPPAGQAPLRLEDLVEHSNEALLERLPGAGLPQIDYYRRNPPPQAAEAAASARPAPQGGSLDEDPAVQLAVQLQTAFARVAERVLPGVVGVSSYVRDPAWTREKLQTEQGPGWVEAHIEELLYPGFRPLRHASGFLASEDGDVLSCDHVLRRPDGKLADAVGIELYDGRYVLGEIVGSEPTVGLAVLRIAPPADARKLGLRPLPFGDGEAVGVGHWAIALGDPPGPGRTYATGVVSAPPARQCYQAQLAATLLQTSITLPPGAYGGPVVDIHGSVIGMSVPPPSGAAAAEPASPVPGLHHALPIGLARTLLEALGKAHGDRSPWLGVSVLEPAELRRRPDLPRGIVFPRTGVYIDDVFEPSPAARAGVRPGDFLVRIAESRLFSVADFQKALYLHGIGGAVTLEVFRDGRTRELEVTIEERPAAAAAR